MPDCERSLSACSPNPEPCVPTHCALLTQPAVLECMIQAAALQKLQSCTYSLLCFPAVSLKLIPKTHFLVWHIYSAQLLVDLARKGPMHGQAAVGNMDVEYTCA